MSNINTQLVNEAGTFIKQFLEENLPEKFTFHNLEHTKYVVEKAEYIGKNVGLSEEEILLVKIAAWFHDIGYAIDIKNHERVGAEKAEDFLRSKGVGQTRIEMVKNCILSTQIEAQPETLMEKVICDADLSHLTEEDYFDRIEKMRQEWKNHSYKKVSKRKFYEKSAEFFQKYSYHTDFAKKELAPKKQKNLERIEKLKYMLEQKKEQELLEKAKKGKKSKGYSRGVESMFRLTARNQINLSSIADNKSNILISVNAIMISIIMTVLVTRFEEIPNLILPTLVFLLFALTTIIFAILSTRPNISSGTFNKEDIKKNKVNLLFFGNFYNMTLEEYEWGIEELMKNDEHLYSTMIKDQYFLGKVLAKKYKLLRIAYNVFMVGIVISVLTFVLAFVNI
ncbi:HD domain-containing protein [Maribellus comscasis]|uniref:HD domain-containing protein n=1 Tax=Maribellus comscasis TaxID=2681766 RepID=A0A6I6JY34_9BACT|nr:Pycsar system effector family protein [Maribellus comscasis]QGY44043.1 HD domain-containing protein [Maribellus comscasis]